MPASDHKRRLTAFVVAMAVLIATPLAVVATTQFTDVPTSSVHHDNIDWLKDAGVTSGCNPPDNDEYCPTDSVTRAQMATFMRNLATNQVVDAATAIEAETAGDADTVDGRHAAQLTSHATAVSHDGENGTNTIAIDSTLAGNELAAVELGAGKGPFAVVTYSLYAGAVGGESRVFGWLQLDNTTCATNNRVAGTLVVEDIQVGDLGNISASTVLSTAGDPDLIYCMRAFFSDAAIRDFQLSVMHVSDGSTPVVLTGSGSSEGSDEK